MLKWLKRSFENPANPITGESVASIFGLNYLSGAGIAVSEKNIYTVPAVLCAVNFLSGTISSLPLNAYERSGSSKRKTDNPIQSILHDAVSDECSSYEWRKQLMQSVLTCGRSITYIERDLRGQVINLIQVPRASVVIKRVNGKKIYTIGGETYRSEDIIDICFGLQSDLLTEISPMQSAKDIVGLAIASTNYGSRFFQNGGVPPFVLTGGFVSGKGLERGSNDVHKVLLDQTREAGRIVLTLPNGHEIKSIGVDPEKSQLVELKRFLIEEIARVYSLPPIFLQDLTHGSIGNTEQQDLHLVKHTVRQWITQIEQELNLKLFGRASQKYFAKFNLDGLLRGDFATRMSGYSTAVQNAILTPNEIRELEDREPKGPANDLLIQGATVPLGQQTTFMGGKNDRN